MTSDRKVLRPWRSFGVKVLSSRLVTAMKAVTISMK